MRHYPREDHLKSKFYLREIVGLNTPVSHHFPGSATCCFFPEEQESPLSEGASERARERVRLREKYDGNFLGRPK